jgi:hypothetical protein
MTRAGAAAKISKMAPGISTWLTFFAGIALDARKENVHRRDPDQPFKASPKSCQCTAVDPDDASS